MPDDAAADLIGRRLREVRAWRGLSLRVAAELAGLSKSYLSMIERGERPVERRSTIAALANALQVAPSELTGQPLPPTTVAESDGHAGVNELRGVLRVIEADMLDPDQVRPTHPDEIRAELDRAYVLGEACDYAALGTILPDLVAQARVLVDGGSAVANDLLILALRAAFHLVKNLGHHDMAWSVAGHLHAATHRHGDPAWIGLGEFLRAEAMTSAPGGREHARTLADRAALALEPRADVGNVAEVYGLLRLSGALQCAVTGAHDQVPELLDEADAVAARTGDGNFADMHFGPPNVGAWRMAIAVEMGDLDRVPHLARTVPTDALPSGRRATFYADLGRGLAVRRGREPAAVEALRRAETLAPQLVHADPFVRDTVTELLRRARRDAGGRELRGLAYRMGMVA